MQEQERLEAVLEMTRSLGFRYVTDEAKESIKDRQAAALAARDWETVCELRGEARQLEYLIHLEEITYNLLTFAGDGESPDADV